MPFLKRPTKEILLTFFSQKTRKTLKKHGNNDRSYSGEQKMIILKINYQRLH